MSVAPALEGSKRLDTLQANYLAFSISWIQTEKKHKGGYPVASHVWKIGTFRFLAFKSTRRIRVQYFIYSQFVSQFPKLEISKSPILLGNIR